METIHAARARARAAIWQRRARSTRRHGRAVVLYYHRIASPRLDPWRTSVSPETFDSHLDLLRSEMRVLSLAELVSARRHGQIPERAVAITFDDGYVDNLEQALPRLERYHLPAVFYIATGLVGTPGPPWWDEIADLLLGGGPRPEQLEATVGRTRANLPTATVAERERALYDVFNPALKRLRPAAIDASIEPLREWAGRDRATPAIGEDGISEARPMTVAELEELGRHDLAELGAHTALHPSLPQLPPTEGRREILASRDMLAELGAPPRSFAYPFGDTDRRSREAVREAGFDHAVGVQEYMPVTTAAREFEIPRMMPFEESAERLHQRMSAVLDLAAGG